MSIYFSAWAFCLVHTWSSTACAIQLPLCTSSVGLAGMVVNDNFATYDLSFSMDFFTHNIIQKVVMMTSFFCSDSSFAAIQLLLCNSSVGLAGMEVNDNFATYDLLQIPCKKLLWFFFLL